MTSNDHRYWYGVITDQSSTNYVVLSLELRYNHLSGSIPSEIATLTSLAVLNLPENDHLTGSIPSEIAALTSLTVLS